MSGDARHSSSPLPGGRCSRVYRSPWPEDEVAAGLHRYAELGATDALVSPVGDAEEQKRTLELLGELSRAR
jgi:hypothetical protein